jgi:hypothetical protein
MPFYKYTYSHPVGSGTVVAGSTRSAREKVWWRMTAGMPFQGFAPSSIKLKRGAVVPLEWKQIGSGHRHQSIPETT